jgi:toxin secretion/phage lysis holin
MDRINAWKAAVTAFLGALTALWGWMGWLVIGWICLMFLDYITGTAAAFMQGKWSSKVAREGIWHKAGMVIVVVVAAGSDLLIALVLGHLPVVALPIEYTGLICPLVLVWYCLTELGSVGENAITMGAPVPAWLPKILAAGKEAVDSAGEHIDAVVENTENK